MRSLLAASLLLCFGAAGLAAQSADPAPGTRVRVVQATTSLDDARTRRAATQIGTLQAIDSASLTLLVGDRSVMYPRNSIVRLDVSRGNASPARGIGTGALRGAGIGAVATGAVVGMIELVQRSDEEEPETPCPGFCPEPEEPDYSPAESFLRWLVVADGAEDIPVRLLRGAAVGGAIGGLVGSFAREVWTPVSVNGQPLPVEVNATGHSLGFTVRF